MKSIETNDLSKELDDLIEQTESLIQKMESKQDPAASAAKATLELLHNLKKASSEPHMKKEERVKKLKLITQELRSINGLVKAKYNSKNE